ncbi:MAG: sugar phosphate isomerase/epimerase family protein [Halobacteriaceae archaeon]
MRLGLNWRPVATPADLDDALDLVDELGVGTVAAPPADAVCDWTVAEAREWGEAVRERGLTVGELGYWANLQGEAREERVETLRGLLRRADAMGAACVVGLVGSRAESAADPHPDNYAEAFRDEVRDTCRAVLDGLELDRTRYVLEPWYNTFFHRPRPVREFLDAVDDDRLGVHMDVANLHTLEDVHRSEAVVDRAFELLGDDVAAVHAKDLALVPGEGTDVVTIREVPPGEGALAYDDYLAAVDGLDPDVPVFTEHWADEGTYVETVRYLRDRAAGLGATVRGRDA